MKNLLWCVIPTIILGLIFIVVAIVISIKDIKKLWYIVVLFVIFAISSGVLSFPYIKDLKEKKLLTAEGTYSKYVGSIDGFACTKIYFKTGNNDVHVYISSFVFSDFNLVKGNKYKITYYKNSHAVYNIELISE